jgi:hypothetical protein
MAAFSNQKPVFQCQSKVTSMLFDMSVFLVLVWIWICCIFKAYRYGQAYEDQEGIQTRRLGQALSIDGATTTRNENGTDIWFAISYCLSSFSTLFHHHGGCIALPTPMCLHSQCPGFKKTYRRIAITVQNSKAKSGLLQGIKAF